MINYMSDPFDYDMANGETKDDKKIMKELREIHMVKLVNEYLRKNTILSNRLRTREQELRIAKEKIRLLEIKNLNLMEEIGCLQLENEDLVMECKIWKEKYDELEENSIRTDCDYIPDCYEY